MKQRKRPTHAFGKIQIPDDVSVKDAARVHGDYSLPTWGGYSERKPERPSEHHERSA